MSAAWIAGALKAGAEMEVPANAAMLRTQAHDSASQLNRRINISLVNFYFQNNLH
jgi:hypothetical protein